MNRSSDATVPPWVARFGLVTIAMTFLLICAGGLVKSKGAGLSVPDWPLSFGTPNPTVVVILFVSVVLAGLIWAFTRNKWVAGIAIAIGLLLMATYYIHGPTAAHTSASDWWHLHDVRSEHGHRLIAGTVGFATFILCALIWQTDKRRNLHRLLMIALAVLILQAVLGGLTVHMKLPSLISSMHGFIAQIFLGLLVAIVAQIQPSWYEQAGPMRQPDERKPLQNRCRLLLIALFVQISLGAAVRHSPYFSDTQEGLRLFMWHFGAHLVGFLWLGHTVFSTTMAIVRNEATNRLFGRLAGLLLGVFMLQALFGFGVGFFRLTLQVGSGPSPLREAIATAHVGIASILVILAVWLRMQLQLRLEPVRKKDPVAASIADPENKGLQA